ncbi:MAG: DNA polymerase III subunit gamma/tau [Acidimicrobiia bacterium]|nr:DNA polymerase III subunit gamma/tau [Acidimicrobiia bacterium]
MFPLWGRLRPTGPWAAGTIASVAYQSLYRRYRSRRFGEIVGQEHVVTALRNAVRENRTGHAYLFSGPRGTGKTSSARILAKALNCEALADGEPCGECASCVAIDAGSSYDLYELDAASNNGVDAMRELIARAALGSPGRTKVYILDEVHMLSTAAANALLKTLEEPPDHVTFVLATTDPQKVLPTIRSRAQHYEFGLLSAADLEGHVRRVLEAEGRELDEASVAWVVRRGAGSARDTLSALDQVLALGARPAEGGSLDALLDALVARDTGAAIAALAVALDAGREPRLVGEELLGRLRDAFLLAVGGPVGQLPEADRERLGAVGRALGAPALARALEGVGTALTDMRQAPDARVSLEVALVRVTRPELDTSLAALVERVAALEAGTVAAGDGAPEVSPSPATAVAKAPEASQAPSALSGGGGAAAGAASEARRRLQASRGGAASAAPPAEAAPGAAGDAAAVPGPAGRPTSPAGASASANPTDSTGPAESTSNRPGPAESTSNRRAADVEAPLRAELEAAWDAILETLSKSARPRYRGGRFLDSDGPNAVFALPNEIHRDRCDERRGEVEQALAARFGRWVPLTLVVDPDDTGGGGGSSPFPVRAGSEPRPLVGSNLDEDHDEDIGDVHDLAPATDVATSVIDRLLAAFPGAEVVE